MPFITLRFPALQISTKIKIGLRTLFRCTVHDRFKRSIIKLDLNVNSPIQVIRLVENKLQVTFINK